MPLARWLSGLTGWKRALVLAALGSLATLALPPAGLFPLLFLVFPALLWVLDGARTRWQAFFTGWLSGLVHFVLGLYWISFSLFTDIARFWWVLPLSVGGLPVLLAVFTGLATLVTFMAGQRGIARILVFATAWSAGEWLRGHLFTGFPWSLTAYAWVDIPPVLQSVAWIGSYGLGLLTVALASLPALTGWFSLRDRRVLVPVSAGIIVAVLVTGVGLWRLSGAGEQAPMVPGVMLRLVQPAIAQTLKWDPAVQAANLRTQIDMSQATSPRLPTVVIWSETAVPWVLNEQPDLRKTLADAAPPGGVLLTGALRTQIQEGQKHFYNSVFVLDGQGNIIATADKFHLVPFGEFIPFREYLPVDPVAAGATNFSRGPGPVTVSVPGLPPFSPLVCYEAIFPGDVASRGSRPQWLLNVTNDAWFGISAGPWQHFAIARVRAVEEGVPLVRVANTGISGVVDPWGRIVTRSRLGTVEILESGLPQALQDGPIFARYGNKVYGIMLLMTVLFTIAGVVNRGRNKKST
ncbi:MAG: apolipoprotein N-acyltransferase [Pseudomonadota bacterium]|nr:apolipoprotein N-acyltransferase [Pseudomonadota bacterium]